MLLLHAQLKKKIVLIAQRYNLWKQDKIVQTYVFVCFIFLLMHYKNIASTSPYGFEEQVAP